MSESHICPRCKERPRSKRKTPYTGKDGYTNLYRSMCSPCEAETKALKTATPEGRKAQAIATAKYQRTEKGKAALKRGLAKYYKTEKGKAAQRRANAKRSSKRKPPIDTNSDALSLE